MTQPSERRTQRERRATTIGKLLNATIETMAALGYARTSVQEICRRAGVSQGGLFRHFETRLDLMVAAAEEVGRRQLADFTDRFAAVTEIGADPVPALRLLRDATRTPVNAVWSELLLAARTDDALRERLAPSMARYAKAIVAASERVPMMATFPVEIRETLLFSVLMLFDGEALVHPVLPQCEHTDRRLDLLGTWLTSLQL